MRGSSWARRRFWLIENNEEGRSKALTVYLARGEMALPVFSHEEEAETFLRLGGASGEGWRVEETAAGDLVSMLYGPCAGVEKVALDPLPISCGMIDLVSLDRGRFMRSLVGREELTSLSRV